MAHDPLLDINYEEGELDLNEPGPANLAPRPVNRREDADRRLRALRSKIYEDHMVLLSDVAYMRDIEPTSEGEWPEEPPQAWVDDVGTEEAIKRYRIAKAAWLNPRAAPIGIGISAKVVQGIAKAEAQEASQTKIFNAVVFMPPTPSCDEPAGGEAYPVIDAPLEEDS